eukprot:897221_1
MAEALFGASRGARDVIQVVIDHNVGAGVITDGHLLHAGSSSLVEIGHTQVDPYGKRCYCGNHGCLETIASVDSILELAQLRLNQSMSSMLHGQPLTVDSLCQAALRERLYTAKTDLGDNAAVPVKLVHINKCPVLAQANTLRPEDADRLGINRRHCLDNLKILRENPQVREKVVAIFAEAEPFTP